MRALRKSVSAFVSLSLLVAGQQAFGLPPFAQAASTGLTASSQSEAVPTIQELEQGIADRLKRVEEFKFIEQEAARLGVRAWLFGGTAAGYAHYVKWDMQREKGDKRFQKDRFDYDYTNIYRSTQDLDIVIDGNADQAQKLQTALQERYPHLQGGKTAWEVRLLTQDMGDKQAILNNPDFMNQHTDSNSTGLVEITRPRAGDSVVRDVRDWKSKEPQFLKDVHDGALHYYFSSLHKTTKFAKEGRNPPILSAIRFLTKAFQYELKIRPEDLARIKKVIDEFDPARDSKNEYVAKWIEKNGKKLFQNAVNIEYAWNTLEKLGLRKKLSSIKDDMQTVESLSWWMNKEPLRTQAVGKGNGKTARELGLDVVAHETNNFLAYESITRAHTGDPNVLTSRENGHGEAAAFGDGFYTRVGTKGAKGTGLTIRFHLDPNAREGEDFIRVPEESFVIVKNKAALRVIPESLTIGPVEYFRMLTTGQIKLEAGDRGIMEKFKRRMSAKFHTLSEREWNEIEGLVLSEIEHSPNLNQSTALWEWFDLDVAIQRPKVVDAVLKKGTGDHMFIHRVLSQSRWRNHPELVEHFLKKDEMQTNIAIISDVLSKEHWKNHPEWVKHYLDKGNLDYYLLLSALGKEHWKDHPEFIERLLKKGTSDKDIAFHVLSQPCWQHRSDWVEHLLDKGTVDASIAGSVLSQPHWKDHPEWVERILKKNTADRQIATYVLSQPHWANHPEWVEHLLEKNNFDLDVAIAKHVLTQPHSANHPEWVEKLIKRRTADEDIMILFALHPHWTNHPELRRVMDGQRPTVQRLREAFLWGESVRVSSGTCISGALTEKLN
ncbi:MAG: hypothetical protein ACJ763_19130 [Bdellovibrionia bacterium]